MAIYSDCEFWGEFIKFILHLFIIYLFDLISIKKSQLVSKFGINRYGYD